MKEKTNTEKTEENGRIKRKQDGRTINGESKWRTDR